MNKLKRQYTREDEFQIGNIVNEILSKWHYYVLAGVLFAGLALLYIKLTLPVYQASSSVLIDESKSGPSNFEDFLSSDLFGTNLSLPTEIGILRSRTVIQKTIDRLNLKVQFWATSHFIARPIYPKAPFQIELDTIAREFKDIPFAIRIVDEASYLLSVEYEGDKLPSYEFSRQVRFGEKVKTEYFSFTLNKNPEYDLQANGNDYEMKVRSSTKQIAEILENLKVEPLEKDANIVNMYYKDVIPLRALDILNTIGKVYIDLDIEDKAEVASLTLKFVDEQLNTTGSMLSSTEKEMQAFKEKNKTVDLSEESRAMLAKLNTVDVDRVKNNIELASLENLYSYVLNNDDLTNLAPSSLGIPDPILIDIITNLQALQVKRKSLAYGVKSDAPAVKVLDQQIQEHKGALLENIKSIQKRLTTTRSALQTQLSEYEQSIKRVPDVERQLIGIKRNFEVNQNIYTYLLQKKAETSIAKATAVSDNKILDVAMLADEPVEPNKKIIAALILLLTLIIPTTWITINSLLRTTINNRDDITSITDIPVIGVIGHSDDASNLVVSKRPKSAMAEAFRTVRTNLKFFGQNEKGKTILITSSVGGEGKSFVTLNLATILAMQQHKTIVIGLDLRKPKLFQDFGWSNDRGASNLLAGTATLDEVIRHTPIPNFDIIISGPVPPNPAELMSKEIMQKTLQELKNRYDYIIIDTPPVGVVSDAFLLTTKTDVNIYLVRQGYSRIEYVKTLDELYRDGRLGNLCILLNDSDFSSSYGYGYGHHYGYVNGNAGYYDQQEEESQRRKGWRRILPRKKVT
jgi:capsular exopolysaccharide synthesis family protein